MLQRSPKAFVLDLAISMLLFFFTSSACTGFAFAQNAVYIAQSAAGSANGTSCANAYPVSYFNTASNWTSGTPTGTAIGPGTTVNLCGTFTASAGASGFLTVPQSGTVTSPIRIVFQSGATIQAPYWGTNGAIYVSGRSNIIIDGGGTGSIQASLNGSAGAACPAGACIYQQSAGTGILLSSCRGVEVRNLTVGPLYVHSSSTDTVGGTTGVQDIGGSTISIHNNSIHDTQRGISVEFNSGQPESNLTFFSNTIYNVATGISGGDGNAGGAITNVLLYNNSIYNFSNWDTSTDTFHQDGIYIWVTNASSSFNGYYIVYNNTIYGTGVDCTAGIYFDPGATSVYPTPYAFNNVINAGGGCGDGAIFNKSGLGVLYNNTIIGGTIINMATAGSVLLANNISGAGEGLWFKARSISGSDHNNWYSLSQPAMYYNGSNYSTLTAFSTATGFDTHSITANPSLNAAQIPGTGSAAVGAGTNLYSICGNQPNPGLGALCYDASGSPRPASGPWTIGAYEAAQTVQQLAPPATVATTIY